MMWSRAGAAGDWMYVDAAVGYDVARAGTGMFAGFNPPTKQVINRTYMFGWNRSSSNGFMTLFIDGKFYRSKAMGAMSVDANCYIGRYWDNTLKLNGRLDNMLFYNVALTPDQINSIYRSANPRM